MKDKESKEVDSEARPMKDEAFGEYRWAFLNVTHDYRLCLKCICFHTEQSATVALQVQNTARAQNTLRFESVCCCLVFAQKSFMSTQQWDQLYTVCFYINSDNIPAVNHIMKLCFVSETSSLTASSERAARHARSSASFHSLFFLPSMLCLQIPGEVGQFTPL